MCYPKHQAHLQQQQAVHSSHRRRARWCPWGGQLLSSPLPGHQRAPNSSDTDFVGIAHIPPARETFPKCRDRPVQPCLLLSACLLLRKGSCRRGAAPVRKASPGEGEQQQQTALGIQAVFSPPSAPRSCSSAAPRRAGFGTQVSPLPGYHSSRHGPAPGSLLGGTGAQHPAPAAAGAGHTCCGVTGVCSSPGQELK